LWNRQSKVGPLQGHDGEKHAIASSTVSMFLSERIGD
jgi:hypothetical protein